MILIMEFSDLTTEERAYVLENELFCNAVVCLRSGIPPIQVIKDLCEHIDNLNTLLDETKKCV